MTASFSSFVFDPDDSVQQRVFQCACGASVRADRAKALAAGWRRVWWPVAPPEPPAAGEPPRPDGLLVGPFVKIGRTWSCPECSVQPTESYAKTAEAVVQDMPTRNMLLFPAHVLGVRVTCCTAEAAPKVSEPRPYRLRPCAPGEWGSVLCRSYFDQSETAALLNFFNFIPKRSRRCIPAARSATQ